MVALIYSFTIQKNQCHVPEVLKTLTGRDIKTSKFAWSDSVMLVSHIPKQNKNVLLLSTTHRQPDVSQTEYRKPEVNLFCNATKGGVDVMDQMIDAYRQMADGGILYHYRHRRTEWVYNLCSNTTNLSGTSTSESAEGGNSSLTWAWILSHHGLSSALLWAYQQTQDSQFRSY